MNERPDATLASELIGTLHTIVGRLEAALEPQGLSLAKFNVLHMLVAAGEPLPLGALAERSACVRSNITQLVVRADDPHDRRSIRAELTAEGRRRHAAGVRALEAAEHQLFAGLPPKDRESLLHLLRALQSRS